MWFLREVWDVVTFADFRRLLNWMDFVMSVMMLICVGVLVFIVVSLVGWIGYTIYRLIAYDYTTEIYSATVTKKKYKPEETVYMYNPALKISTPTTNDAEYNVHFVTENGLRDVIDDEDLYYDVRKGSKIRVTMKVGRNRSSQSEIKYWRVTHYSW